jgi:hypothetical protein
LSVQQMARRELKLVKCVEPWAPIHSPGLDSLKVAATKEPAKAYYRNLLRVYAFMMFPAVAVSAVAMIERVRYDERLAHRKELRTGRMTDQAFAKVVKLALDTENERRDALLRAGGQRAKAFQQNEMEFGFGTLEDLIVPTELIHGADAWLAAQISGVWTAFEALAEDIWIAAVNAHPRGLAELKGAKRGAGEDKKVDLSMLQRFGYDLSKNMGTVLSKRYSFDRLEDMRRAYDDAKFEGEIPIADILKERSLDVLSLTRHVVVHNGGLADEAFLRRKDDLPPELIVAVGEPLPLNGEIVAALIGPVIQLGWDLIMAMDQWLLKNPQAPP